jgi:hypothetical protein
MKPLPLERLLLQEVRKAAEQEIGLLLHQPCSLVAQGVEVAVCCLVSQAGHG